MTTTMFPVKRPKSLENWQSEVPTDIVERAKALLKANYSSFRAAGNFIGVGKEEHQVEIGRVCHASMSSIPAHCRDVLATANMTVQGRGDLVQDDWRVSKEEARPFLEWFLYHSPYGFIILNRDDFESCENYGFVLAGDAPTNLVQSACIISRHFAEVCPQSFRYFNELVARGIDGMIAYQLCFNSNISSGAVLERSPSQVIFFGYRGHRVSSCVTPEVLLNYYKGEVGERLAKSYKEKPSIYGSTTLFLGDYYPNHYELSRYRWESLDFHNFLLEKEGKLDKSAVYRPPNPFAPKPVGYNEYSFTVEQALTDVADYMQKYIADRL